MMFCKLISNTRTITIRRIINDVNSQLCVTLRSQGHTCRNILDIVMIHMPDKGLAEISAESLFTDHFRASQSEISHGHCEKKLLFELSW